MMHQGARGNVDEIHAQVFQIPSQNHGLLDVPASVRPVRSRDPDEQWQVFWHPLAQALGDLEHQSHAVLQASAVAIGSVIAQG